jgi:hypothetical protein
MDFSVIIEDQFDLLRKEEWKRPDVCIACGSHVSSTCAMCAMLDGMLKWDIIRRANKRYTNRFARAKWGLPFAIRGETIVVPLPRMDHKAMVCRQVGHRLFVEDVIPARRHMRCTSKDPADFMDGVNRLLANLHRTTFAAGFDRHVTEDRADRLRWAADGAALSPGQIRESVQQAILLAATTRGPGTFFAHLHGDQVELLLPLTWTRGQRVIFAPVSMMSDSVPLVRTLLFEDAACSNIVAFMGCWCLFCADAECSAASIDDASSERSLDSVSDSVTSVPSDEDLFRVTETLAMGMALSCLCE